MYTLTTHTVCMCILGSLYEVNVTSGDNTIILKLPMSLYIERRYNNSAAVHYG